MDSLPLEILDIIACAGAGAYRGLLCYRRFTDSLTVSRRVDFMISLGHTVKITAHYIEWKYNGNFHRVDGPAIDYCVHGIRYWSVNDGMVVEWYDGYKSWYVNGKLHRDDGPAIVQCDGAKWWFENDIQLFNKYNKYNN